MPIFLIFCISFIMVKDKYKNQDNKYFRTTSFYIAAFLFAKGLELVDIDSTDSKRCKFVFLDIPQREKFLEVFNFGKENSSGAMIDARKFVMAIKMLKDKLYQNKL